MVAWLCMNCGAWASKPHKWLRLIGVERLLASHGKQISDIPILTDHRLPCELCGALGAEWHHWLPQAIWRRLALGDVWLDVGAYLCKAHHDEWHEAVTWYLPGRTARPLAQRAKKLYTTNKKTYASRP